MSTQVNAGHFFLYQNLAVANGIDLHFDPETTLDEHLVIREGKVTVTVLGLERTLPFRVAFNYLETEVEELLVSEHLPELNTYITQALNPQVRSPATIVRIDFHGALIQGEEVAA